MAGYLLALLGLAVVTPSLWLTDVREHRLPNRITGPAALWMLVAAGVGSITQRSPDPLRDALLAGGLSLLVYGLLFVLSRGGFGMGDVKLGGVIGLALGLSPHAMTTAAALVLGFVIGAGWSLGLVLTGRAGLRSHVAFGPFMLLGAWLAVLGNGALEQWMFGAVLAQ